MPERFPIVTIPRASTRYPKTLAHISDAPAVLYCRGNIKLLKEQCFAVVGTRKLTAYGKEAAHAIVRDLVPHGLVIVSGLALGIDAVAHQAALDAGGNTIAVLGSGVDDKSIYPRTNHDLARDILAKNGLIVSEYPAGTQPQQFTFPARNRIISGLSRGVLVIEADYKSGALITAQLALDYNRDVFAVPGGIFSAKSIGPNLLIQKGAKLVLSAQDIIQEYQDLASAAGDTTASVSTRDPLERKILDILGASGPTFVDAIINACRQPAHRVTATLALLEIRGTIKNMGNGMYLLKR